MGYRFDLSGQRFGRLTVIRYYDMANKMSRWLCKCDCGKEKIVTYANLKSGGTKSCGCFNRDLNRDRHNEGVLQREKKKRNSYQISCKTPPENRIKNVWANMHRRCENKNSKSYSLYGGRGIAVCDEWKEFEPFKAWAIANGYNAEAKEYECTLDRIDVNKNYSPENCRWVRQNVQNLNKRNNVLVTYNGETKAISEWAKEIGMEYDTLRKRIVLRGWSPERALTTPT